METYRKDLLPPEGLGFVGPAILEEGWSLVRSGHVTVHPGTGTMSGTVGEAGRMPVAVELRLPIGPNRPPRCAACGTVWCRHAVAVALRSWSRAADGEDRPAATKIVDRPAEPAPPPVAPHAWWANLSEADPGWFRLELGIVLEGRRVDLVVDAIVPMIGAGEGHGARGAADGGRRIGTLEQHAGGGQAIEIRGAAAGAAGDGRPLLLVGLQVQDIGPLRAFGAGGLERGRRQQEFSAIDHLLIL